MQAMRTCTICKVNKNEQDFFFRNKSKARLHAQCKDCHTISRRKMWRAHYHKYGSNYRARAVERSRKIKDKLRQHMKLYLADKACVRCGIADIRLLEFDHIDPSTKSFSIARGLTSTLSWDKILAEISKCQILCANCHKLKTAEEQNWYRLVE